jgi:hypothetical protein
MIWGDVVHVPEVQIRKPQAGIAFDVDSHAAAVTRMRILDLAASGRLLIAGMHTLPRLRAHCP